MPVGGRPRPGATDDGWGKLGPGSCRTPSPWVKGSPPNRHNYDCIRPSAMTSAPEILSGRYRLGRLLGRGGMSDVYLAVDQESGREVAVKIVRSGDPDLARRLAQEARALEGFDHPGLVRLLDTGVAGDQAYLVMEFVDGSNLAEILRRGRLAPGDHRRSGRCRWPALSAMCTSGASCTAT